MRRIILCIVFGNVLFTSYSKEITGTVRNEEGRILPFATIQIKGTKSGTTANSEGRYQLQLDRGTYTLVCQHVNFKKEEKTIVVEDQPLVVDFILPEQKYLMEEVVIRKGEDPAISIIRNAINKREQHKNEMTSFSCDVYTKGNLRLRDFPDKVMGRKFRYPGGDSAKNKILFLSETISRYSVKPGKEKIEVKATRISGMSNGYGLSTPQIISFYENNVAISNELNPRGFISPISDNAMNYYRYKFEGFFYEDGLQISRIKVIPRRKFEPLFSGYINIIEDSWRIHSVDLMLTASSQMQVVDTLRIEQIYSPQENVWMVKSQVLYPVIRILGFESGGSFVNVYSDFDIDPQYPDKYFNNTIVLYKDSSNRRNNHFWLESRPVALLEDEAEDYRKKDSIEQAHNQPRYLDSIQKRHNRTNPLKLMLEGQTMNKWRTRTSYTFPSVIETASYNTVEGPVINYTMKFTKKPDSSITSRRSFTVAPTIRYGFSNRHWNPSLMLHYSYGKKNGGSFSIGGGKRVFQFNNDAPVRPFDNSISTLAFGKNYMKIYEAGFASISWAKDLGIGLGISGSFQYQDRMPLENTSAHSFSSSGKEFFTANFPTEISEENIPRHQATVVKAGLRWQPGAKYIEFPDRRINTGSRFPVFGVEFIQGVKNFLGSDISYSKWQASVGDQLNLKLLGSFRYKLTTGGFLNKNAVYLPDYNHLHGNQLLPASPYLNSFQLIPYYKYSNTNSLFFTAHAEHHFNGLFTNKIPLFRKLNWNLVAGNNSFIMDRENYYTEIFAGLENIFRLFRVDIISAYSPGEPVKAGFRVGMSGALFNK